MRSRSILVTALALVLAALACTLPGQAPAQTETPPAPIWPTYTNDTYGFSIRHPPEFEVPGPDHTDPFGTLGEQIVFSVGDVSPADCVGDCPVVESTDTLQVGGHEATRLAGYIGAIGGNSPQQYQTYVFQRGERFYSFTLYALGRSETPAVDDIQPLQPEDVALFEQMLATLQFAP